MGSCRSGAVREERDHAPRVPVTSEQRNLSDAGSLADAPVGFEACYKIYLDIKIYRGYIEFTGSILLRPLWKPTQNASSQPPTPRPRTWGAPVRPRSA